MRIAPKDPADTSDRTREMLEMTKGLNGEGVLNIFTTMAHHPRALRHSVALGGAFMFAGCIEPRHREIVIIRVAHNTRCEYEYAQHFVIAQALGLTADECRSLLGAELPSSFSAFERDLVAAVDELCANDVVGDQAWAALSAEWDDTQMIEFVMVTGYYRMLAGFLSSAGVEIDAGLTGFDS